MLLVDEDKMVNKMVDKMMNAMNMTKFEEFLDNVCHNIVN